MRAALPFALMLTVAACSEEPPPATQETDVPEEFAGANAPRRIDPGLGTPLNERVATLGLLNKRNNISQDIKLKPGESRRVGNVIVRLSSCERAAPWESPPETGAFVQVLVQEREAAGEPLEWRRVFSGWLFKNAPSINVVEHPVYDVWVKDCAMRFPGDEAPASDSNAANPSGSESTPRPSPSPSPSRAAAADDDEA